MRIGVLLGLSVLAATACAIYGARIRFDQFLRDYPVHDPFRRDQEREGVLWIGSGGALLFAAALLWWMTRQ